MAFSFLDIKIGRGAETPLPWSAAILARVVEEISNLSGKRGENSAVEEEIETCENNTADYFISVQIDSALGKELAPVFEAGVHENDHEDQEYRRHK